VRGLPNLSIFDAHDHTPVGITQSLEHGISAAELLQKADEAMYAAKQAGGDRIVVCETAHPL